MKQKKALRRDKPKYLHKSKCSKGKIAALSVLVCLVAILSTVTLAWLMDEAEVKNTFTPASVDCEVRESFDNTTKSNVTVENTGTTSAYIRAIVVANWVDNAGNVYYQAPVAGTDYRINYGADWTPYNGYYYYGSAVDVGGSTGALITTCTVLKAAPVEGYHLDVEIVAEAIQSEGTNSSGQTPAFLAWGVDPEKLTEEAAP